jgi:hypothetical protein
MINFQLQGEILEARYARVMAAPKRESDSRVAGAALYATFRKERLSAWAATCAHAEGSLRGVRWWSSQRLAGCFNCAGSEEQLHSQAAVESPRAERKVRVQGGAVKVTKISKAQLLALRDIKAEEEALLPGNWAAVGGTC